MPDPLPQQESRATMPDEWIRLPHGKLLVFLTGLLIFFWQWGAPDEVRGIANYAPLHTALEMAAIIVAFLSFAVVWSSDRWLLDGRLLLLGNLFAGVGLLDIMHMMSYKGMPDLVTASSADKAIYFWLAARYLAAGALLVLVGRHFMWRPSRMHAWFSLGAVLALVALVSGTVLYAMDSLPRMFIEGSGLTPLKIALEYGLIALFGAAAFLLFKRTGGSESFDGRRLAVAATISMLSEFCFTLYVHVADLFNVLGHIYKIVAYSFIYRAVFVECIRRPYTDLQQAQRELVAYRDHLEDSVQVRTAELALAKEAAEAANIAKSAFLANMSHEIRTPLNAITGLAKIIQHQGLSPKQNEQMDKLEKSGHHLAEVINDILDLSKIEAGKFDLAESDLRLETLAADVKSILHERLQAKGLEWVTDLPPVLPLLRGDATRLLQALLNYAGNAVKFTEKGRITLRILIEEATDQDMLVRFEVEDMGIGIAPQVLPRLFSPFEQADNSSTRPYGGTGLGLVITRKIAVLMGGNAGVSSTPGLGSTFWFTARLGKAALEAAAPRPEESRHIDAEAILKRNHAGRSILLVEDELVNQEVARFFLEEVGLQVDVAADGLEAVAKAEAADYDLILMDMQMPRMNGLEATQKIHALPRHADTPILAMTANAFAEDKARCLEAGMDDFITKPVERDILYKILIERFT